MQTGAASSDIRSERMNARACVDLCVCEALIDISQGLLFLSCSASEATPRGADGRLMRQLKHDTAIRCDRHRRATENPWGIASFFRIGGFEMWFCASYYYVKKKARRVM